MKEILYLVCEVRGWLSMFTFFGYMPHAAIILEVACRFSWTQRNCVVLHFGWLGPPGTRLWRHQERGTTAWGRFGIQMITALQVSLLCFWCIFFGTVPIWINQWYESMHCNEEVANFGTWIFFHFGTLKKWNVSSFQGNGVEAASKIT